MNRGCDYAEFIPNYVELGASHASNTLPHPSEIDECVSDLCEHGGTCTDHLEGFVCECSLGYRGVTCSGMCEVYCCKELSLLIEKVRSAEAKKKTDFFYNNLHNRVWFVKTGTEEMRYHTNGTFGLDIMISYNDI